MGDYVDVIVHGPSPKKNISTSGLVAVQENDVHIVLRVENQKGTNWVMFELICNLVT